MSTTIPSSSTVLIPRISAVDILKAEPIPPPPDPNPRDASQSASTNRLYTEFHADRLIPFDSQPTELQAFHDYIERMSRHVDFDGNITGHPLPASLPHDYGHAMRNEADVRVFANSFYIDPVRPILLEMLPDQHTRSFDWRFPSEISLPSSIVESGSSVPDMALSRRTDIPTSSTNNDKPVVLIEFKAPHLVYNCRTAALQRKDISPDWTKMTKQLRKYSAELRCRRIILMDERMAWFFYLSAPHFGDPDGDIYYVCAEAPDGIETTPHPISPLEHSTEKLSSDYLRRETIAYRTEINPNDCEPTPSMSTTTPPSNNLLGSSKTGASSTNPSRSASSTTTKDRKFTIRELIAFSGYHALKDEDKPGIPGARVYRSECAQVRSCDYKALFPTPRAPLNTGTDGRTQRNRNPIMYFSETMFSRVYALALTTDDYLLSPEFPQPEKYSGIHLGACNTDTESGYHSDGGKDACAGMLHLNISKNNIFSSTDCLNVQVTHRFKPTVFVATTSTPHPLSPVAQVVAKRFSRRIALLQELRAYSALLDLQGNGIPGCIGVFTTTSDPDALYLLLEYVPYSTLAESSIDHSYVKKDAWELLAKMHECRVCHGDLSASNILVHPEYERALVVVDFGMAWVGEEAGEKQMQEDLAALKWLLR